MKKTNFLSKLMVVTTLFAISLSSVFGQYVGPTNANYDATAPDTSDYVTVGSQMPYYVAPDAGVQALITLGTMTFSQFKWSVPAGIVLDNYAGTLPLTVGGAAGYYVQNEMSVVWSSPSVAVGTMYTMSVLEHSIPASGVFAAGCDGTLSTREIYVIARPTLTFPVTVPVDQASMPCGTVPGAGVTYYLPVNMTGIGPWAISYTVAFNGGAAAPQGPVTLGVPPPTLADATVFALAAGITNLNGVNGLPVTINGGTATNGYGKYVVTITNVTDQISQKSLNPALIASQAGDIPAASFTVYVNPTPATNPIQHIKN